MEHVVNTSVGLTPSPRTTPSLIVALAFPRNGRHRGGSGVKYYELSDGNVTGSSLPEIHFCHEHKAAGDPLSGVALLPPECLDIQSVEVARLLRLTSTSVEPGKSCGSV